MYRAVHEQGCRREIAHAGARKVVVSALPEGPDATIVYGVNDDVMTNEMTVVSNASCTTNCLVPMVKVLDDAFVVQHGYMLTVHSYTADQPTVDTLHKNLRRARAAAVNIIPTSTGAARAIGLVMPDLKGKLDGSAMRVPTPNVSVVALDVRLLRTPTVQEVHEAMRKAASGRMKGILAFGSIRSKAGVA